MSDKKFYLMIEKDQLPICNQNSGASYLDVDQVIRATERTMPADSDGPRYRVNPYVALVVSVFSVIAVVMVASLYF